MQNYRIDPVMFGVHQGGKLLIQTRTKTKQSSSRLDKELSPMVDIKHDRVYYENHIFEHIWVILYQMITYI